MSDPLHVEQPPVKQNFSKIEVNAFYLQRVTLCVCQYGVNTLKWPYSNSDPLTKQLQNWKRESLPVS